MKTIDLTPEEMEARTVRFKKLRPRSAMAQEKTGIPPEVSKALAADKNYTYMAPLLPNNSVITENAAMRGGDAGNAISLSMAICGPDRHHRRMTVAGAKRKRIKLRLHEAQEYASRKGLTPMLVSNP